jgi:hypothetical protein
MTRILSNLTAFNLVALAAAFAAGWLSFFRGSRADPDDPTFLLHVYLGLISASTTLGVHCLVFIYFLGTGRWVKEVALAYRLPDDPLPKLTRDLKRKAFPPALAAMLVPIATAAAGAGVQTLHWPWPLHALLAVAALAVNVWAFVIEYRCVKVNGGVIDGVMREVDRIRAERGLPSNAEALEQQG